MLLTEFTLHEIDRYRMTVQFGITGNHQLSFAAVSPSGEVQDLGVAFIHLSCPLWPAVCIRRGNLNTKVHIYYCAGSQGTRYIIFDVVIILFIISYGIIIV